MPAPFLRCLLTLSLSIVGVDLCLAQNQDKPSNVAIEQESSDRGRPMRVLLVTGGCCHDYPRQAGILAEGMETRLGKIDWTVVDYGKEKTGDLKVYKDADWAKGYDLIVHNECYGGVEDAEIVQNIIEGHASSGVPAVAIQCSMHSYREAENADLWRAFLGVTSRFHEKAKRSLTVVPQDAQHRTKG